MYIQTEVDTIERAKGVPRPIVSHGTTIPLQKRNTKTEGIATESFSFSNITVPPLLSHPIICEDTDIDIMELAHLMVDATRHFTGSIEHWQFLPSDSHHDLVLRCTNRLRDRAEIEHIEVLSGNGYLRLVLKRHIANRSTVYCIPLGPIMPLHWKNPTLFHILFSFVKSLPYINLFHTGEDRVDWLWEYLFEEEEYHQKNGSGLSPWRSIKFFSRYEQLFNEYEPRDWKTLLENYCPRKPLHKKIKRLLLKADIIDFQIAFRIGSRDEYDSMFEHWESFLVVDDEDSEFTRSYIEMLNECSNEYDIISAYQYAIFEKGNIQDFEEGTTYKLNQLEEFLSDLTELLRQL